MRVPARFHEFIRFCLVGAAGAATDFAVLELLAALEVPTPLARLFSMLTALQLAFALHTRFTFAATGGFSRRRWLTFNAYNALGAALNYAVFLLVIYQHFIHHPTLNRLVALATGTLVALTFNYHTTKRLVFKKHMP